MAWSGVERRVIQDGCKRLVIIECPDKRAIWNYLCILL